MAETVTESRNEKLKQLLAIGEIIVKKRAELFATLRALLKKTRRRPFSPLTCSS